MTTSPSTNDEIQKITFRKGEIIFKEGDSESHFFIIESGEVQIFTLNKQGQKIDIYKIDEGESFGEFALLDKAPRSASALALTDCTVVKVSEKGYQQLVDDIPVWASSMLSSFIKRIKNMNDLLKKNALKQGA
jgi:CRP/FNR family transcriptional regulator, cyclic AMP receptor protein